jgi:oligopeptide/dipeptide ABC transporter ATP-binding protein
MGSLLSVSELTKAYEVRRSPLAARKTHILALAGVTFNLEEGETLGIVGESGSGKSTLARCALLLERPDSGAVFFRGRPLLETPSRELKSLRRDMQIIFQDPYSSLNPRKKVIDAIGEPLVAHGLARPKEARERVMDALLKVGLDEDFLQKYPHEMSGGQRQRVAIGRAVATKPSLVVADEPVSSLDVSIQAQIINLFLDIKQTMNLSMLFVSHDLNIVRFIADRIIVLYRGSIVESGLKDEVFGTPFHPYTRMLLSASEGGFQRFHEVMEEGRADGCRYYERCGERGEGCNSATPVLQGEGTHRTACFACGSGSAPSYDEPEKL